MQVRGYELVGSFSTLCLLTCQEIVILGDSCLHDHVPCDMCDICHVPLTLFVS